MVGISGWISKNEISIGEVLSNVSLSDGKLNADMIIRISQWFGGDRILWGALVKDRIFLLISLQNSKKSQTSFTTLQIINSSRSWSMSSGVGRSIYSIHRIREK